ncbi:Uncharacterized protein HZ326_25627 [Fusarium oxysporum f. sp. albedinis]|nr:Uncharacterized protein HZ326_25627 [Fusarium oxysporum f. sp. albedinis]
MAGTHERSQLFQAPSYLGIVETVGPRPSSSSQPTFNHFSCYTNSYTLARILGSPTLFSVTFFLGASRVSVRDGGDPHQIPTTQRHTIP